MKNLNIMNMHKRDSVISGKTYYYIKVYAKNKLYITNTIYVNNYSAEFILFILILDNIEIKNNAKFAIYRASIDNQITTKIKRDIFLKSFK